MQDPPKIPVTVKHGDWTPLLIAFGLTGLSWILSVGLQEGIPIKGFFGLGSKDVYLVALLAPGTVLLWFLNLIVSTVEQFLHFLNLATFEKHGGNYLMTAWSMVLAQLVYNYIYARRARVRSRIGSGVAFYVGLYLLSLPIAFILVILSSGGI